jgi:hypothetical protein
MAEKDNNPDARAYVVRKSKTGGKSFWTPVGAAWVHKDGKGFNIDLAATPIDGRLVLRAISAKGETLDPETGEVLDTGE